MRNLLEDESSDEEEDIGDEVYLRRHLTQEQEEAKRYLIGLDKPHQESKKLKYSLSQELEEIKEEEEVKLTEKEPKVI